MTARLPLLLALAIAATGSAQQAGSIKDTAHNLSITGPGPFRGKKQVLGPGERGQGNTGRAGSYNSREILPISSNATDTGFNKFPKRQS